MPKAALLAFDDCYASSVAGFADVLQIANSLLRRQQGKSAALFDWRFVSLTGKPVSASNGMQMETEKCGGQRFDLVFIPALHYGGHEALDQLLEKQSATCSWLISQWTAGAWLAANCTGTFVLGKTGLLDGRLATTTWWLERQFRRRYPKVDLRIQPVVTEVDRLMCAGASASCLLQVVRVVERFCGPTVASQTAKTMMIDTTYTTQLPFIPLLAEDTHSDSLVKRAQHWLQRNMSKEPRITHLADHLGVSDRTLIRRFAAALHQTPRTYLQGLRLEVARALLENGDMSVDQIAEQAGYADVSSFSRLFRRRIGMSPGAYRARFRHSAIGDEVRGPAH